MSKTKSIFILLLGLLPSLSFGQNTLSGKSFYAQYQLEIVLTMAAVVCLVVLMAMFAMLVAMKAILQVRRSEQSILEEKKALIPAVEGEETAGFWRRFWNRMNASVPVARENEIATNHEYDGIRELDNRLPPWWVYGFYLTIIFAVIYLINFEVLGTGPTQDEEFQTEMAQAKADVQIYLASLSNLIDESNVTLAVEAPELGAGQAIFEEKCAVCHAVDGGGGVGPNLTDQYWLHGGDLSSIFSTIKYGVPSKGMIAWESQLSPQKMQQVASYIYSMEGQETANPKEPQGELFQRIADLKNVEEEVNENAVKEEGDVNTLESE